MAKINVDADGFADICVCFILDKLLNPDDVCFMNEDFNKYAEKLLRIGVKPLSLKYYLSLNSDYRVYYKRIKDIFEYDANQSMIINIWPSLKAKEDTEKKDNIVKRVIKKLLMREDINSEEEQLLREAIGDENRRED
jgi:hypothetical protein